ncbi:MAG: hypothetical protein J4F31_09205 [Flavobacteriales bacterium]|nr:hypothetical protein [Flavobacteriales bacterium]
MKRNLLYLMMAVGFWAWGQPEDRFVNNRTYEHSELIEEYRALEKEFAQANLIEYGKTDVGRALHLFVMNRDRVFDPLRLVDMNVLLIMNGIHPGESCGVDASLKWCYDLLANDALPENVVIAVIPIYNIGGALNRRPHTRANQNGPEGQGFRGNVRNLDLNRDFIKADTRNTEAVYQIFQDWDPDVFIDTHTTDGADYPYDLTLIATQPDALGSIMGQYMRHVFEPVLFELMAKRGEEITPYVNVFGADPLEGWERFFESPRYSTGFAALHHCFTFVTEAHMLKPYEDRVVATYTFLDVMKDYMEVHHQQLRSLRNSSRAAAQKADTWPIAWELDTTQLSKLPFKGYKASKVPMESVPGEKIDFDQGEIVQTEVDYYEWYKPSIEVEVPEFYIVPQAWGEIAERLIMNGVVVEPLPRDSVMQVEVSYITDYSNADAPYEGHFMHNGVVKLESELQEVQLFKGDLIVRTDQAAMRFIVETLEPQATDSYFRWGFFDSALQQKEWYSGYIFDTTAVRMLNEDAALRHDFEAAKEADPRLEKSGRFQMYWLYQRSELYERKGRYPVFRVLRS